MENKTLIIGAGISGLAAGYNNQHLILEKNSFPGGICASYYQEPFSESISNQPPENREAYRFERGAGLWIWGKSRAVRSYIHNLSPCDVHERDAAVYLADSQLLVPFPIQNNLRFFDSSLREKIIAEMTDPVDNQDTSMAGSFTKNFGPTLSDIFFHPFHENYTRGLYRLIAPPDSAKSPINLDFVKAGAVGEPPAAGYNSNFMYPVNGLDDLVKKMSQKCRIKYDVNVSKVDPTSRTLYTAGGDKYNYDYIISTLPLDASVELSGLKTKTKPDPRTGVMVINIGAVKTKKCPTNHWIYIANNKAGFHRVGFYSNIEKSYLPLSYREENSRVAIYVERSYLSDARPDEVEVERIKKAVVQELISWGWIESIEVISHNLIDFAYTWRVPNSTWVEEATSLLEENNIFPVGRFAKWSLTEAIAESIRDGFIAGTALNKN